MKNLFSLKKDLYPLLRLAIPLAINGIVQSLSFFFENIFLAHLGHEFLAAGALVSWLFATLVVILFGTLNSINILVALKHGAKDAHGISFVARDGLLLAILVTIPAILVAWNMSPVFLSFGQTPAVVLLAKSYLHALAWGLLPNFIMAACLDVIMGLGHARVIMIFSILSVTLNIFWSYVLIFGKFGFPFLSIAGAGWGMTVSNWITLGILFIYILLNKYTRSYFKNISSFTKPYYLYELFKTGLPMGVMYSFEVGFFFALTLAMGFLGSQFLAANQIAMQYLGFLMSMIFSIAQAITVRMGHLIGARDIHSAERASYIGTAISASFMVVVAIIYWFFPELLISVDFDIHNPVNFELIQYAKQLFAISAFFQIFEATRISLFGSLRALKDTKFTLFTSIISFWFIALPFGYLLAIHFHFGANGYWLGMVTGAAFSVIFLYLRFKSKINYYYRIST